MTFAARVHEAVSGSGFQPLGTMALNGNSYDNIGSTETVSVTFNTDGTISGTNLFDEPGNILPSNWYGPTTGGIGNSFQVRFTLQSGLAWDTGLVSGTLYALSSSRTLTWSLAYDAGQVNPVTASVLVEVYYTAGTTPYKSGTLTVSLYNGEA